MIQFVNGVDAASALAERELAEDDAKHRVLGEPSYSKFGEAKRINNAGEVISEKRAASISRETPGKHFDGHRGQPRPELRHNFRDPGEPIK